MNFFKVSKYILFHYFVAGRKDPKLGVLIHIPPMLVMKSQTNLTYLVINVLLTESIWQ